MYSVFLLSNVKDFFRSKELHKIPAELFRNLKCCVQRITKGFCFRDIWSIDDWFLNVMPDMLDELKTNANGVPIRFLKKNNNSPTDEEHARAVEEWNGVLTEMAFLLREANENTCQRKNPYAEAYWKVKRKFTERFGFNGKWVYKRDGSRVLVRRLSDIPKYRELDENYHRVENELGEYRYECQKKALSMFAEYFNDLWD